MYRGQAGKCDPSGARRTGSASTGALEPAPLPSALCRLLNDKADEQARCAWSRRADSLRVEWLNLAALATQWEERAILASARAGELFW